MFTFYCTTYIIKELSYITHRIMAPMTRSQTRSLRMKDVFTTPGIVTQIASNLQGDDIGLASMYKLFNDERYREEMEPFVEKTRLKRDMIREIKMGLENNSKVQGGAYKIAIVGALYEYLEDMEPHLRLLGKCLARTIGKKIEENLVAQVNVPYWFKELMLRCKDHTLADYIAWGYE